MGNVYMYIWNISELDWGIMIPFSGHHFLLYANDPSTFETLPLIDVEYVGCKVRGVG